MGLGGCLGTESSPAHASVQYSIPGSARGEEKGGLLSAALLSSVPFPVEQWVQCAQCRYLTCLVSVLFAEPPACLSHCDRAGCSSLNPVKSLSSSPQWPQRVVLRHKLFAQ